MREKLAADYSHPGHRRRASRIPADGRSAAQSATKTQIGNQKTLQSHPDLKDIHGYARVQPAALHCSHCHTRGHHEQNDCFAALSLSDYRHLSPPPEAQEEEQTFPSMKSPSSLDWNDTQFDWSQNHCLDLGSVRGMPADCRHRSRAGGGAPQPASQHQPDPHAARAIIPPRQNILAMTHPKRNTMTHRGLLLLPCSWCGGGLRRAPSSTATTSDLHRPGPDQPGLGRQGVRMVAGQLPGCQHPDQPHPAQLRQHGWQIPRSLQPQHSQWQQPGQGPRQGRLGQ